MTTKEPLTSRIRNGVMELSKTRMPTEIFPHYERVIECLGSDIGVKELAKLYRAHEKNFPDEKPRDSKYVPPGQDWLRFPKDFVFQVALALSANIVPTPPLYETRHESQAQIKRTKKLIKTSESSGLPLHTPLKSLIFLAGHHDPDCDIWSNEFHQYISRFEGLGSLADLLEIYIDATAAIENELHKLNKPHSSDPAAARVKMLTRRLFNLTGTARYAPATRLINLVFDIDKTEEFGKKHRYNPEKGV